MHPFPSPPVLEPSRRGFLRAAAGARAQSPTKVEVLPDIPDEATGRPFPEAEPEIPLLPRGAPRLVRGGPGLLQPGDPGHHPPGGDAHGAGGLDPQPSDDPRFQKVEDRVTVQTRFASGPLANLSTSFTVSENRVQILGTEGTGILNPATSHSGDVLTETGAEVGSRQIPVAETAARQFTGKIDHLSRAAIEGFEPAPPARWGCATWL